MKILKNEFWAFIAARKGSKSIKNKNLLKLNSVPLIGISLRSANKIFFPPKKKKYLILDRSQSTIFSNYLKKEDVNIMDTRYESINLLILLKTFLNFKFSFNDYIKEYIKNSGCEVIISFIDNKIFYYKLKRIFPQKTVILIQNGMRTEFFFKKLSKEKDLKLDYLLTFSNFYSKKYAKYVDGRCITIGSIKNNLIEKKILIFKPFFPTR